LIKILISGGIRSIFYPDGLELLSLVVPIAEHAGTIDPGTSHEQAHTLTRAA
jgi:hypothetical protein